MISLNLIFPILAVLLVSSFIRSSLGFGDAVIAMPLLAFLIGIRTATPLIALLATTTAVTILLKNWRQADFRSTLHLVLASLAGIPFGLLFLKQVPENIMKIILGSIIAFYGAFNLIKPRLHPIHLPMIVTWLFGFIAGILGGAYNTNGPPIVIYGHLRGWPSSRFRATLQGYFLPTGFLILAGHGLSGLWTSRVIQLYLFAFPVVMLGIYLGGAANKRMPHRRFAGAINAALVIMGLLLLARSTSVIL
jgi:uncharacterized protein